MTETSDRPVTRDEKVASTRSAILDAAERLYAERGIGAVSNRQISEAAGQGNNTAVSYHFGTKADLLQAIVQRHQDDVESRRTVLVNEAGERSDVRVWVNCLVRPTAEHLASLGSPTWYARVSAQIMADPALRELLGTAAQAAPALRAVLSGLERSRPELPRIVREQRDVMSRQLITYGYAEREEALAEQRPGVRRHSWEAFTSGLVDAVTGLWLAPWTPVHS
ncbi:TetR family transcriptional regulator [Microbacterium mangrovi]|uniref:TetR family transcriptional regulator n=1 Tax=Microbacterium mangrovi TaxID=1348253 RepID=A0A0B2AB37_9MICO|nr:helix-turn-helix domain-containing protein [Microbacterium mangrovi]KHK98787.1 TetR family transcriptional regulator [Microbacterium mangrovi]